MTSAEVRIPANRPAPPAKGRTLISSSVAVAERKTVGAVPDAAVKMFWADVARLVPVAAPRTGETNVGVFAKTNAPVPVSSSINASNSVLASISVSRRTLPVVAPPVSRTMLPVTSGKVHVLFATVTSAEVRIPANRPAPPVAGASVNESSVAVDVLNTSVAPVFVTVLPAARVITPASDIERFAAELSALRNITVPAAPPPAAPARRLRSPPLPVPAPVPAATVTLPPTVFAAVVVVG